MRRLFYQRRASARAATLLCLGWLVALFAACGEPPPSMTLGDQAEALDESDAGADGGVPSRFTPPEEFADPEVAACTSSSLTGACSSSYEYQRYNLCNTPPNTKCDGGYCEQVASCYNFAFGYWPTSSTTTETQTKEC